MSEELKQQQEQNVSADVQEEQIVPEVKDQISKEEHEKLLKLNEDIRKTQQGVDKQNAQLKKQIEEIEEKYLNDAQKLELEKQKEHERLLQEQEEVRKTKEENEKLNKELLRNNFIIENKVAPELKSYLTADSKEGLQEQYESLKQVIEQKVSEGVTQAIGTTPPQKGESGKLPESVFGKTPLETLENITKIS